jgi:uncharacterized protein YecT (DUF1311 family)
MTSPRKERVLRKVAALGVALFWNTGLFAANENHMTKEYLTCVSNAEGVTNRMLDCISAEFELPKDRKESLVEAQRAWINFRDANCGFYHDPDGGSAAHLAGNECMLNVTVDRANELEKLLSGY